MQFSIRIAMRALGVLGAVFVLGSVVTDGVAAQSNATGAASAPAQAAATITPADVLRRLGIIADDSMKGRDTPSPGLEMTAAYIAQQFKSFGLRPAGDSGTYIQRYPYAARQVDQTAVMLRMNRGTSSLKWGRDFFVVPSPVDSVVGIPMFIGTAATGMVLPPDTRGRILIAAVPDTIGPAWQERLSALFPLAMGAGASGVIVVMDPRVTTDAIAQIAAPLSEQMAPFPVFGVRADAFADVLRTGGFDPAALFSATVPKPASLSGVSLRLTTPVSSRPFQVPNVVAILEGSDPVLKNEYVVFSAHMDHVGISSGDAKGDSINNGADDDGSGTTAVVEIAQAFASMKTAPRRSIIFLTVSGEEKGLLGSDYFTQHLPVPAANIVADINIDMIGRNHPDSVTAIGLDYTSLGPVAKDVAAAHPELHLVVARDMQPEEHLFERSDHFNFAKKKIPAIFFTTGLHADYHRPSDEVKTIDTEKLARVAQLAFHIGNSVANATPRPTWTQAGLDVVKNALPGGQ